MDYEKIIKRKIRESKMFKKGNKVKIIGVKSNTYDFVIKLIKKLNNKYNLNLRVEEKVFSFVEDIKISNKCVLILPAEAIVTNFILYLSGLEEIKDLLFEKSNNFFNITYRISEIYLSQALGKKPYKLFRKYKEIENFVYNIFSRNEKYVSATIRSISYLLNFL